MSLKVTSPTLLFAGSTPMNWCMAFTAAKIRSGRTSVASIDPETSASSTIVALGSDATTWTLGRASAAPVTANASASRTTGRRHAQRVRRFAVTSPRSFRFVNATVSRDRRRRIRAAKR